MKGLLVWLLAGAATPAIAQQSAHSAAAAPAAETSCTPEHAAMGHCTMSGSPEAADPHTGHQMPAETDPHAAHDMPAEPDPHAGHATPAQADPHAGHDVPAEPDPHARHETHVQTDPHAGHDTGQSDIQPPVGPPPPEALTGPEHAADSVYGGTAMALARSEMNREHGALPAYRVLIDRFEARVHDGSDDYALDAQAWYGGDLDKFWVKVEGHGDFGGPFDGLEMQALWSHAIGPWFDAQLGVRYDVGPASDRRHLVLAVQGLAPYWIEVEGAAFLSEKGDLTAQFEAEHDVRISQKLILQPHGEIAVALQDVPEAENGSGLSNLELGLRLRYELVPEFAPYFGVAWSRAFGDTARMRRAEGEDPGTLSALLGLRFWF